jgi:hypothetical protein
MPIIFNPNSEQQIVGRGERLGICKKILMFVGFPVDIQSPYSEDIYTVSKYYPPVLQITDETAKRRQAIAQERAVAQAKRNPNPGSEPRRIVPKGKP